MERSNVATKVGITVIIAIVVLVFAFVWLGQLNPYGRGYIIKAKYSYVAGLLVGSRVQLMGVKVGEVMDVTPEGTSVIVDMEITNKIKIPKDSKFLIVMRGIVGDKAVEILPPNEVKGYLNPGDVIDGNSPARLDLLVEESQSIITATRKIIADPKLGKNIKSVVANLEKTTSKMTGMFKKLDGLTEGFGTLTTETGTLLKQANAVARKVSPDVQEILSSTNSITKDLRNITSQVSKTVYDPESIKKINTIINDTNSLIKEIETVVNDIGEITHDPELKSNIKSVTKNAKQLTDKFLNPIEPKKEATTNIGFKTELLGSVNLESTAKLSSSLKGNFNITGNMGFGPTPFYLIGLDEIGEKNLINFQLGLYPQKDSIIRFGVIRGKLGFGTDFALNNKSSVLSGEIYDIVSPHFRLGFLQNIFGDYGLSLYWDNQFVTGQNEFNLGVRWQPK